MTNFELNPHDDVFAQITKYAALRGVRMCDAIRWSGYNRDTLYGWRKSQPKTIKTLAAITFDDFRLDVSASVYVQLKEHLSAHDTTIARRCGEAGLSLSPLRWKTVQPKTVELIHALIEVIDIKSCVHAAS